MFEIKDEEKLSIVTVKGEKLNAVNAGDLKTELVNLNSKEVNNVVLDLSNVRYCDSSGLSALLVGNRLSKNSGGSFVICGVQEMVSKLITISQLDSILYITPTVNEARDLIIMEEIEKDLGTEE